MAKGKKTGGKDFKPGLSGNPQGRTPNPPELKQLQQLTKGELELILNKILHAKPEELNNFNGTILEKWLASIVYQGMKTGDFGRLNGFFDRLPKIGKVKEEITGEIGFKIIVEDYTKK